MAGRYERVCVGWHCAKVKGHAELKIENSRVKTFIYDFPKLHHFSHSKVEKSKGRPRSSCAPK